MLTKRDTKRLDGVDPRLVSVVKRAFELWEAEFNNAYQLIVVEGLRTKERQAELYAQGRTVPGKVVTWTLNSKHIDGKAVDLAPAQGATILWNDLHLFDKMIDCMLKASDELAIPIRSGADWDRDGKRREAKESDSPHFELWP
jgi:peptidoglycan LD-endopeptidase CwlK